MSAPENEPGGPEKPKVEWQDMSVEELVEEGRHIYDRQRGRNGRDSDLVARDLALLSARDLREMRQALDNEAQAERIRRETRLNHIDTMRNIIEQALGS